MFGLYNSNTDYQIPNQYQRTVTTSVPQYQNKLTNSRTTLYLLTSITKQFQWPNDYSFNKNVITFKSINYIFRTINNEFQSKIRRMKSKGRDPNCTTFIEFNGTCSPSCHQMKNTTYEQMHCRFIKRFTLKITPPEDVIAGQAFVREGRRQTQTAYKQILR